MGKLDARVKERLEFLSNIEDTDYPFINLYLNVNAREFFDQNRINSIFIKNSFRDYGETLREHSRENYYLFKNDEEKIKNYLENELDTKTHGVTIFACEKLGIFETFQSVMPFENSFVVGSFPHLRQLAYQADEYENALVVMIDGRYARIFNLKLGGFIQNEFETESILHRFHKQGGWAQSNHQRHIIDQKEDHYREIARIVSNFVDMENYDNVILIGQEYEIENFRKFLPKRINFRIIDTNALQRRENINDILESIVEDLSNNEHKKEERIVENLINRTYMSDSSTLGVQDTIDMVQNGAVRILTLAKDLVVEGFKCGNCLYVSKDQYKAGCPKCNGDLKETDLVEEAVRLTIKNRGQVEIVENHAAEELQKHEGMGAYLRY